MSESPGNPEAIRVEQDYSIVRVVEQKEDQFAAIAYNRPAEDFVFIKGKSRPTSVLRLEREADVLESLSHHQIPKLIDTNFAAPIPYIVTEHMPGTPHLQTWFERFSAPRLAAKLCLSALAPLEHVHGRLITHRDVKLPNLLMKFNGQVSLVDFELALARDEVVATRIYQEASSRRARITQFGTVVGTPDYVSPEQAMSHHRITHSSDIYSLGISLFSMLYGRMPFSNGETEENIVIARRHCFEPIDLTPPLGRNIPSGLIDIVEQATQKEAVDRYGSAAEMSEDLERYLAA